MSLMIKIPVDRLLPFLNVVSCRVEVIEDTKIPNAATIKVVKQDHTLGNLIRA